MRTRVIDDESDYFSTNSVWLSKEVKEELRKKEEELQKLKHSRARNLILDFTGMFLPFQMSVFPILSYYSPWKKIRSFLKK